MASMRTAHRRQAELEAQEHSAAIQDVVTVYKLVDGRYEVASGWDHERGGSAIARFNNGIQEF